MRSVYVMMPPERHQALLVRLLQTLHETGVSVAVEEPLLPLLCGTAFDGCPTGLSGAEGIIGVGGDGTLLRACQVGAMQQLPLLGVNIGHLGFLAEIEIEQFEVACQRLVENAFTLESRMTLQARYRGEERLALNDVVLSRGGYARLINVEAFVGSDLIGRYSADGLIVASPTGSTGYSLSAGGPILSPELECMLLTPICAHSLQHRPVVVSAGREITLQLSGDETRQVQLSIDGQTICQLAPSERVTVSKSERTASFIRFAPRNDIQLISRKLSEWSR